MFRILRKSLYGLRSSLKRWSKQKDLVYHDGLFRSQVFDPFGFHFVGYITIRRFADLTAPYLKGLSSVLDLGCGPGEITCELAGRYRDISFRGVDHSPIGVEKARQHAENLGLKNVCFEVGDIESFSPEEPVDAVLMFDAFHHLMNPARFVRHAERFSSRFVLIEPRGDWKGSWRRDLDFDWVAEELEKIRARLSELLEERDEPPLVPAAEGGLLEGAPVEHRYTLTDFRRFFPGYGLKIRGTLSGLNAYPPHPFGSGPLRERCWRLAYDLYREIDDYLFERDLDLLAKHWVVYAEKGSQDVPRKPPRRLKKPSSMDPVQSPYDVEYSEYDGPRSSPAGEIFRAAVKLRNRSYRTWSSADPEHPDHLSYHWLDRHGLTIVHDGLRSPIPRPIGTGEDCVVEFRVQAPGRPGRYILAVDCVQEGAAWFSEGGSPCLKIPFRTKR